MGPDDMLTGLGVEVKPNLLIVVPGSVDRTVSMKFELSSKEVGV